MQNKEKNLFILVFVPSRNHWNQAFWEFITNKSKVINLPKHSALVSNQYLHWKAFRSENVLSSKMTEAIINGLFSPMTDDMTQGFSNAFANAFKHSFMYANNKRVQNEEKHDMISGFRVSMSHTILDKIKRIQNHPNFGRKTHNDLKSEYDSKYEYLFYLNFEDKLNPYGTTNNDLIEVLNHHNFVMFAPTYDFFNDKRCHQILNFLSKRRKTSLIFHYLSNAKEGKLPKWIQTNTIFPKINESRKLHFFNPRNPFKVTDLKYADRIKSELFFFPFEFKVVLKNIFRINKEHIQLLRFEFVMTSLSRDEPKMIEKITLAQLKYLEKINSLKNLSYSCKHNNISAECYIVVNPSTIKLHKLAHRSFVTKNTVSVTKLKESGLSVQSNSLTIDDDVKNQSFSRLNLILKHMRLMPFIDVDNTKKVLKKISKHKKFGIDTSLIYIKETRQHIILALAFIIKYDKDGKGNRKNKRQFLSTLKQTFRHHKLILQDKISWSCMKLARFKYQHRRLSGVTLQIVCGSNKGSKNEKSILTRGLDLLVQFLPKNDQNRFYEETKPLPISREMAVLDSNYLHVQTRQVTLDNSLDREDDQDTLSVASSFSPSLD